MERDMVALALFSPDGGQENMGMGRCTGLDFLSSDFRSGGNGDIRHTEAHADNRELLLFLITLRPS